MSETRSVECTAPDIEEAIAEGLKELDVSREKVIVEILEEPTRGLLGIGARFARVRLTTTMPPRSEREEFVPSAAQKPASPPPLAPVSFDHDDDFEDDDEDDDDGHDDMMGNRTIISEAELEKEAEVGLGTVRELLGYMGIDANIQVEQATTDTRTGRSPWVIHVTGSDLGVLIGHRGKTLAALQYVSRLISSRDLQQRAEFIVDVEGYKARRQESLERMAQRLAKEATRRRRTVEMEPMPPNERRIIHMALRDNPSVETISQGEGTRRRVTIIPK